MLGETRQEAAAVGSSARERILDAAYELFSRRGVQAVGVNEVIERAGVATATLYRHFPSKEKLVLAFLDLREQRWTKDLIEAGAMRRGSNPEERLLRRSPVFTGVSAVGYRLRSALAGVDCGKRVGSRAGNRKPICNALGGPTARAGPLYESCGA